MPRARWFISTQESTQERTPTAFDSTTLSVHVTRHYFIEHPSLGLHPVRFLQEIIELSILPSFGIRQYLHVYENLRLLRFFSEVFPTPEAGG